MVKQMFFTFFVHELVTLSAPATMTCDLQSLSHMT